MMKRPRQTIVITAIVTVVVVLVVLVLIGLIVIYSGAPNVAATDPHWPITAWILGTAMENSVRAAAADVSVPPDYNDIQMRVGYSRFSSMCLQCHGAPGMDRHWIGQGLTPEPPELSERAAKWSPAEIFWIVKHGIKMTGMPALAPTHSDDAIWTLAAFVERLPGMTPEEYQALGGPAGQTSEDSAAPQEHDAHDHEHTGGEQAQSEHEMQP
jgi:mono/diheme cytochrome c family protein